MSTFDNAVQQLKDAACVAGIESARVEKLTHPDRVHEFMVPVLMDSGVEKKFQSYRVQFNNVRGPYKGGIRFHEHVDLDEIKALAFWMTIKTAVVGIPMGGGKGGVIVNPKDLSGRELEELSRGWARHMQPFIGPTVDVPAPDVNTSARTMDWMVDEYEKGTGDSTKATFTGKSIANGGSEGRNIATALGGFYVFEAALRKLGLGSSLRVAVQGFGNAGYNFALLAQQAGHTVVGVSDSKGGVYQKEGLDLAAVSAAKEKTGSVAGYTEATQLSAGDVLTVDCDVLVPAALENQITPENAKKISAKIIIELANGPTTPDADALLWDRGVYIVPDVLANAGGVTVSYFEWDQNVKKEHWTQEEVFKKLEPIMKRSFDDVWEYHKKYNTQLRTAAFILAIERLLSHQKH